MTHITRLEKWIAPRALPLLAVISALVLAGGVAAYFIVAQNFERVGRLERMIQCQHNIECREFVERAIREILREQERGASKGSESAKTHGVTFRLGSKGEGSEAPILVEGTLPEGQGDGQPAGQNTPQNPPKPPGKPHSEGSPVDTPKDTKAPQMPAQSASQPGEARNQRSAPAAPEPAPRSQSPQPLDPPLPAVPSLPPLVEDVEEIIGAVGNVVQELPCTAIREVNGLC